MDRDVTSSTLSVSPDSGIPELIRRLTDDSKRLAGDEVRLAKMELGDSLRTSARGAMWMGAGFGVAVLSLVALTVFLASVIGRLAGGHYWLGAAIVGVVELAAGALCVKRGVASYRDTDFTFERSRETLRDSAAWARDAGRAVKAEITRQPAEVRAALREGLAEAAPHAEPAPRAN